MVEPRARSDSPVGGAWSGRHRACDLRDALRVPGRRRGRVDGSMEPEQAPEVARRRRDPARLPRGVRASGRRGSSSAPTAGRSWRASARSSPTTGGRRGRGVTLGPELPRLLRRADADPQRLRRRRRRRGARTSVDGDGDGRHGHLRHRRRGADGGATTCAHRARRATGAARSSPTTTIDCVRREVLELAAQYRAAAQPRRRLRQATPVAGDGGWLADVPGFPGERCDARIVADVVALDARVRPAPDRLLRRRAARLATASIRSASRSTSSPSDGDWSRTMRARAGSSAGRRRAPRAGAPAAGRSGSFFTTAIPGHGDPAHTRDAAPAPVLAARAGRRRSRARAWVRVLIRRTGRGLR